MDDFEQEGAAEHVQDFQEGAAAPEETGDFQGFATAQPEQPSGDDFGFPQQGGEPAVAAEGASDPFASEGSAPAFSEAPAFTEAPPQQAAQDTFAYEPSVVAEPPPPPVPTGPSPYQLWEIENQKRLDEKKRAEENEKNQLVEEAQAERDLFYSQRKKKIDATMSTNRESQKLASDVEGANIWDKAVKLIEVDATKTAEAKKTAGLDLGKYKALLIKLKHKPIACA